MVHLVGGLRDLEGGVSNGERLGGSGDVGDNVVSGVFDHEEELVERSELGDINFDDTFFVGFQVGYYHSPHVKVVQCSYLVTITIDCSTQ